MSASSSHSGRRQNKSASSSDSGRRQNKSTSSSDSGRRQNKSAASSDSGRRPGTTAEGVRVEGQIWSTHVGGPLAGEGAPEAEAGEVPRELDLDLDEPRTALILALADDELLAGHRASHWTGVAPSLEEDIAFSGIAQDEINHADVWYQVLVAANGTGGAGDRAAVDRLALGRHPSEYRHAIILERPPRDFGYTLARHLLYDHADAVRLAALVDSADPDVAAVSRKLAHEERYHLEHADAWFARLAHGDDEQRERLGDGLRAAFEEALWIFEPTAGEEEALSAGVLPTPSGELLTRWLDLVGAMLEEADLADAVATSGVERREDGSWAVPEDLFAEPGGRRGRHTPDFTEDAWVEMTALHRAHAGATW
jgi:ring-1,2-phenylacetyl-CoA epoxidase subunit PaaC